MNKRRVIIGTGIALAWLCATALNIEYAFGFASFGTVLVTLLGGSVLIVVIGLVMGVVTHRWQTCVIGTCGMLLCISALIVSHIISTWQMNRSFVSSQPLVAALQDYRSVNGEYPARLEELVPKYLQGIPATKMGWRGTPYHYVRNADNSFALRFNLPAFLHAEYDSNRGSWRKAD